MARLTSLVRKELVRPDKSELPGEDAFRFRHLLIRDAAYDALPKATRAELHERFAGWLAEHGRDLVELDEILGYHLEQACRYRAELGWRRTPRWPGRRGKRLAAAGRRALCAAGLPGGRQPARAGAALSPPDEIDRALVAVVGDPLQAGRMEDARRLAGDVAARRGEPRRPAAELCARIERTASARISSQRVPSSSWRRPSMRRCPCSGRPGTISGSSSPTPGSCRSTTARQ